ncbi:MAG TPA: carbohydrate porin [Chitinophagaceae bacterium]|nr:carbohydrate porin [Chitinophagaceae bacterium]
MPDRGITLGINGVLEGFHNFRGGKRTGTVTAALLDLTLNLDLEKLWNLKGGSIYFDLGYHQGRNPTDALVGDLQVFDKNNAAPYFQMFEAWYQQQWGDLLRIKVGKVDANAEFSLINNGLDFITSSAHVTPTLFVFPTFPDPEPSIDLFFTPGRLFYASFGVFDANRDDHFLDFSGSPGSVQPSSKGELLITETGLTWKKLGVPGRDGNLRLGFWDHTGEFLTQDSTLRHGTGGFYVVFNQTLWKPGTDPDEKRGLRCFLEWGQGEAGVVPVFQHLGGGLEWTGFVPGRPSDAIGLSIQHALLSPAPAQHDSFEMATEGFYKFQITKTINLQPDLQYIRHPAGRYPDAVVGTLQVNFNF